MKAHEIAEFVGGELHGDPDIEISSVAKFSAARAGQLAFFDSDDVFPPTEAACVLIRSNAVRKEDTRAVATVTVILTQNPKLAFARIAAKLHGIERSVEAYHPTAVIAQSAHVRADHVGAAVSIGENSHIGEGCRINSGVKIGNNVTIGKFTVIHPNCVIYDNVSIGNDCVIHAGTIIGADGFGYVKDEDGTHIKFPQIGTVVIEDNVEVGANTCVDRGALGETRIGEGTKIDNLVQIAHNVSIGKRCIIAAQTGISGSVVIEDDCIIGGQVGIGDHVTLKKGVVIASKAGVYSNKIVPEGVWAGIPARPLKKFHENVASLSFLPRMRKAIDNLNDRIKSIDPNKTE